MKRKIKKTILHFLYQWNLRVLVIDPFKGIGHQAVEPGCFVIEKKLGLHSYRAFLYFPVADHYQSNAKILPLIKLWRKFFLGIVFDKDTSFLGKIKKKIIDTLRHSSYPFFLDASYYMTSKKTSNRAMLLNRLYSFPLLRIKKEQKKEGEFFLKKMGISVRDRFVLFHHRTPKFMNSFKGEEVYGNYEKIYTHRNDPVDTYKSSLEMLLDKGFWCIRIGHYEEPLSEKFLKHPKLIDYPFTDFHSQEIDIFLLSRAYFLLGANSGLSQTPGYFGVPVVQVNGTPFIGLPYFSFDIGLIKLYYSEKEKRLLNFSEIVADKELLHTNDARLFEKAGISLISNDSVDILDAVKEMLDKLEKREKIYTPKDNELQKKFKALFSPKDYCFDFPGRVSREFIRKYTFLL